MYIVSIYWAIIVEILHGFNTKIENKKKGKYHSCDLPLRSVPTSNVFDFMF